MFHRTCDRSKFTIHQVRARAGHPRPGYSVQGPSVPFRGRRRATFESGASSPYMRSAPRRSQMTTKEETEAPLALLSQLWMVPTRARAPKAAQDDGTRQMCALSQSRTLSQFAPVALALPPNNSQPAPLSDRAGLGLVAGGHVPDLRGDSRRRPRPPRRAAAVPRLRRRCHSRNPAAGLPYRPKQVRVCECACVRACVRAPALLLVHVHMHVHLHVCAYKSVLARACMCVRVRACECMCLRLRVRVRVRVRNFSFVLLCARGSYCVWYLLWQLRARVCGASACCRNVLALRTSRYSRFVRLSMYIPDARIPVNSRLRPPARHTSIHNRPSHILASPLPTKPGARARTHAHTAAVCMARGYTSRWKRNTAPGQVSLICQQTAPLSSCRLAGASVNELRPPFKRWSRQACGPAKARACVYE